MCEIEIHGNFQYHALKLVAIKTSPTCDVMHIRPQVCIFKMTADVFIRKYLNVLSNGANFFFIAFFVFYVY